MNTAADVYAIIREVETKYGPIQEYRAMRDSEVASHYQMRIFAVFRHKESANAIPSKGVELSIDGPVIPDRAGGIALEDVDALLSPVTQMPMTQALVPDTSALLETWETALKQSNAPRKGLKGPRRELPFRIDRSSREWHSKPAPGSIVPISTTTENALGRKFLAFSGFAPLQPIPDTQPSPLNEDTPDYWMRRATCKWAEKTGLADPGILPHPGSEMPSVFSGSSAPSRDTERTSATLQTANSPPTPTIALTPKPRRKTPPQASPQPLSNVLKSAMEPEKRPTVKSNKRVGTSSKVVDGNVTAKGTASAAEGPNQPGPVEGHQVEPKEGFSNRFKKMVGSWL